MAWSTPGPGWVSAGWVRATSMPPWPGPWLRSSLRQYLAAPSTAWQRDLLSRLPAVAQTPYAYLRDVTLRCRLPPGHYLVVPSTYRALDEAAFVLRLFAERTPTAR